MIAAPCTPTTCPPPRGIPEEVSSWTDYILQIGSLAAFMLAILVLAKVWYVMSNRPVVVVASPGPAAPQAEPIGEPDPLTDPADIAWRAEQAAKAGLQVERTTVTGAKKITVAKFVPAPEGDQ